MMSAPLKPAAPDFRQAGKVGAMRGKDFRTETKRAKAGFGLGQLDRIDVQSKQLPPG